MPQYRRLTQSDRHLIEAWLRDDQTQALIAQKLGRSASTVSREIERNRGPQGYFAIPAQNRVAIRRKRCRRRSVVSTACSAAFFKSLKRGESPEIFCGRQRYLHRRAPSVSSFYRHAKAQGWARRLLPRSGCRGGGRYIQRQNCDWKRSIKTRPAVVSSRKRYGDWERDTLYAAKQKRVLVLLERKSRYLLIAKLSQRTAEAATRETKRLLRKTSLPARTMTNDNGSEFNDGRNLHVPVFYCEPGKPHQRGAVENVNRLLRRHIPRSADLDTYSPADIQRIQNAINDRPRKCLGFRTAAEVMRAQLLRSQ